MSLALLLFAACANQVTIIPGQDGCIDYNFTDPAESTVDWEASSGGTARAWRSNALMDQTGLIFEPNIAADGNVIHVYEAWTGGETADAFCYEPSVAFEGVSGELQVRWYLAEGDTVPYDSVDIEAE
ncbi:MAG: hypothetical protein Q8P41_00710 [Pseudomonadota bacterium]|nr:hypothetical protein [Pseudomonadota bacterium]